MTYFLLIFFPFIFDDAVLLQFKNFFVLIWDLKIENCILRPSSRAYKASFVVLQNIKINFMKIWKNSIFTYKLYVQHKPCEDIKH